MPRQTPKSQWLEFPDGFRMEVSTDGTVGSNWKDVGVLAGGAQLTFNWDEMMLDGGNYEGLVDDAYNPSIALAPTALWNWDPAVIKEIFGGLFKSTAADNPSTGTNIEYNGTSNRISLNRFKIRLTQYSVDASGGSETDADIRWQFILHFAKIDAGASFNFKGVNEDGLNEISVSFTGKPDPASTYALFSFFQQAKS